MVSRTYSAPPLSRAGAAAVELAILAPILVFLFLVGIDYCRIFYVTQTVQNCAYAGAMYASQTSSSSSTNLQTAAQNAAVAEGTNLDPPLAASNVTSTPPDANNNISVTVTYTFNTITSYPGFPSSTTITRTVTMRVSPVPGS